MFEEWTTYEIWTFILLVITSTVTISLGLRTLYNWFKRRKERKEYDQILKDPFEVHFFIPRKDECEITYAKQDNYIHDTDELEIPKGIEDIIWLRIIPRINTRVSQFYFGFRIGETSRKNPEISYHHYFVKEASFQKKWYKDMYGHLHICEEGIWNKDEIYVRPFKMRTYDEGDYRFHMRFHLSCNEYKSVKEERHTVTHKELKIKVR